MAETLQELTTGFARLAWGPWLLLLLLGGGGFFLIYSRWLPFKYLPHAFDLLRGRYDDTSAKGHISHFQALSTALSGTIGMGNISGVALAIAIGGPGAIFWMWVTAIFGIATKFFTCTLAVLYRHTDESGEVHGGPMYVIKRGLPRRFHFLASWFAIAGMIGCLPMFGTNQVIQITRDAVFIGNGWLDANADHLLFNLTAGLVIAILTGLVVFGGIRSIGNVAAKTVPAMTALYLIITLVALVANISALPDVLALIVTDAFSGDALLGGSLLTVIQWGVQRGAFSNEAGIGTESLAHGAARTNEPVREGLVAMCGPIIDTLLVCTATAMVIILSDVWRNGDANGVTLTANAFASLLGPIGLVGVFVCVLSFGITTIFTYSFYGSQCARFLWGTQGASGYRWGFIGLIIISSTLTLQTVVGLIDGMFALMAIPTMVSALWLAPKVMAAARLYFANLDASLSKDAQP